MCFISNSVFLTIIVGDNIFCNKYENPLVVYIYKVKIKYLHYSSVIHMHIHMPKYSFLLINSNKNRKLLDKFKTFRKENYVYEKVN